MHLPQQSSVLNEGACCGSSRLCTWRSQPQVAEQNVSGGLHDARSDVSELLFNVRCAFRFCLLSKIAQISYHLNRAMDNGPIQTQAVEVVTHFDFYAGWPNAFSALPVVKDVFEKRPR